MRLKRPVDDGCSDLEHQMSTTWRPAHLLARAHPAMEQPLYRPSVGEVENGSSSSRADG
jgi:hypothetical protein